MDSERKDSDLEEDPELEALRMAALATLKSRAAKNSESEKPVPAITIPSTLSSVPYNRRDQVPGPLTKGQNSWRNSSSQPRRGRGRGTFPKVTARSNLIVITPVTTEEKDSTGRTSKSSLTLPQHRWCQPVNEDSSSPKTYSKRGPTRFNRHESDSESSDSDYDNSDRDSYSNETILQDENSTTFPQITPEESNEAEHAKQRTSERRLSFQNTTLDDRQDDAKATYSHSNDDTSLSTPNDNGQKDKDAMNYSTGRRDSYKSNLSNTVAVNGGFDKKHRRPSDATEDSFSGNGAKMTQVEIDGHGISNKDLRAALKKKTSLSDNGDPSKSDTSSLEKQVNDDKTHSRSRSNRSSDNQAQDFSSQNLNRGRNRFHSSSASDSDRERSRDRRSKRYSSRSPARRSNSASSSSPNRNGKRSWSRSPVKRRSLDRKSKQNGSRSPSRNCKETQSPMRNNKSSHSPLKNHKHSTSSGSDHRVKRNNSLSPPYRSRKSATQTPERNPKKEDRHSPHKSQIVSPKRSPARNSKKDNCRSPYNKSSVTRSPDRSHKNRSPDKVRRKSSPHSPERKFRQKISWSPDRNRKRDSSRSVERKNSYSRRDRSRSPIRVQKRDSPLNSDRSRVQRKDKYSRHRSSRSSSTLSSSSNSSHSVDMCVRSISSVIKPVQPIVPPKVEVEVEPRTKRQSSSDSSTAVKKVKEEKPKLISSLVKSSIVIGDNRISVAEVGKRLPVHMRLGALPRNKLIRMTKDVEAAFVNSSSDDDVSDGKKQNLRVEVNKNDVSKRHVEKSPLKCASLADSKSRKKKAYR